MCADADADALFAFYTLYSLNLFFIWLFVLEFVNIIYCNYLLLISVSLAVYLHNIGQRFLAFSQPFDAARNPDASPLCRAHMQRYLNALNNFDLWALKSEYKQQQQQQQHVYIRLAR